MVRGFRSKLYQAGCWRGEVRKVERFGRLRSEQSGQEGGGGGIPDISLCKSTRMRIEWPDLG